jgi:hypothetical protein
VAVVATQKNRQGATNPIVCPKARESDASAAGSHHIGSATGRSDSARNQNCSSDISCTVPSFTSRRIRNRETRTSGSSFTWVPKVVSTWTRGVEAALNRFPQLQEPDRQMPRSSYICPIAGAWLGCAGWLAKWPRQDCCNKRCDAARRRTGVERSVWRLLLVLTGRDEACVHA